ncbi:citron Rho-interacting kinase [Elysia marginata]|uniref:Citron Rho-interacting kinase n=1 Tax=Elysia marginata TaxID=1093978 RepID=A0AAV4GS84_9GAST|nr:citron Rho-interacting kinase [Elysia marginata]
MWQPTPAKMEERDGEGITFDEMDIKVRRPMNGEEITWDKMDLKMRHPINKPGYSEIPMPIASEQDNKAMRMFNVDPTDNLNVYVKGPGAPQSYLRQDSSVTIDKKLHGKRLAPPEADVKEAVSPRNVSGLGVTRKIAQKRMREDDQEKNYETDRALQEHIGELNIGFEKSVKLAEPNDFQRRLKQAQAKNEAILLISEINKACRAQTSQDLPPGRVLFDDNLQWSDLDSSPKEFVGNGSFGTVSTLRTNKGKSIIQKDLVPDLKKAQALIHANEVQIPLNFADCNSITRVLGISWGGGKASIFQEHAGLSLRELMQIPKYRDYLRQEENLWKFMLGLCQALRKLHSHGIRHRDIKPENTCWDPETGQVRLIDFASCRTPQDQEDGSLGGTTPEYLPPDVSRCILTKRRATLTEKSDVWGAGMVALYIIKGGHPVIMHFANMTDYPQTKQAHAIRMNTVLAQLARLSNPLPSFFVEHPDRPDMEMFLRGCLAVDEEKRWTSPQALKFIEGKLSPEPVRKYRKLNQTSSSQANLFGTPEDQDLGKNLTLKAGRVQWSGPACHTTNEAQGWGGGFVLKTPAVVGTSLAAQHYPPGSELVTAVTSRVKPLLPQKMSVGQGAQPVTNGPAGVQPLPPQMRLGVTTQMHPPPQKMSLSREAQQPVFNFTQKMNLGQAARHVAVGTPGVQQTMMFGQSAQPVSPWVNKPETGGDNDLAWLMEICTKPENVKPKPVTQGSGAAGNFSSAVQGGWQTGSCFAPSGSQVDVGALNLSVRRNPTDILPMVQRAAVHPSNVSAGFNNHRYNQKNKKLEKVMSPLPDDPEEAPACTSPPVVGMWGQPCPQHQYQVMESRKKQLVVQDVALKEPQGNIPKFLE